MLDEESIEEILGSPEPPSGWRPVPRCDWCGRWCKVVDLHPLPVNPAIDGWAVEICTKCNDKRKNGQ